MAFEGLTGRLQDAFSVLRKKGKITEADLRLVLVAADFLGKQIES